MTIEKQTVLIVDDDVNSRKMLREQLKSMAKIILAKNGIQAIELAKQHLPTLILLDVMMPIMNGFSVLEQLKQSEETQHINVIFITALDSHVDEAYGLKLGACDYIHKPYHYEIVNARVSTHLELAKQRKLLEDLAHYDSLTMIPNRRFMEEHLTQERAKAVQAKHPLCIAMIDVDFFKSYNDNYGHRAGDIVLKKVARHIKHTLTRESDFVCRYGGEEFCIILPNTEISLAEDILDACRLEVQNLAIEHSFSEIFPVVTVSIGACVITPRDQDSLESILVKADDCLYESKNSGRNQVTIQAFNSNLEEPSAQALPEL